MARAEQYSIPFPVYMDKETFQSMAEDGMLIYNHDFHRSVELVFSTRLLVMHSNFLLNFSFTGRDSHPEYSSLA